MADDMLSEWGVRSTSSLDPRYNNHKGVDPSNWRGPIWINANAMLVYGLNRYGFHKEAVDLATRVVRTLANDLRATNVWHECYNSSTGSNGTGLAAAGFMSWNTLGARLLTDAIDNVDPFVL